MMKKTKDSERTSLLHYLCNREYSTAITAAVPHHNGVQGRKEDPKLTGISQNHHVQDDGYVPGDKSHQFKPIQTVQPHGSGSQKDQQQWKHAISRSAILRWQHRRFSQLMEDKAAARGMIEQECQLKSHPKSTFVISFNKDGSKMATLHKDHTIRIIDVATGRNIQTLVGHPRSPWTVDFHKSHSNILASGCLAGQVRIWDLTSGVCDIWNSGGEGEVGSTITSLALHPTEKLLLIAESHNVHVWNWKHSSKPQLYASSKWPCEKVRWIKFSYSGDMFYTGITAGAEYDSWNILRQAPSAFEIQQQHISNDLSAVSAASRARNQYSASLNATVSLGEMLGNPLEISNDLLMRPSGGSHNESGLDVYHAATTFAQLHRIHTGDGSEEGTALTESSHSSTPGLPNMSRHNYLSQGRSPRRPTTRESQEGRFDTTQTWSPSRARRGVFTGALQASSLNSATTTSSLASLVNEANAQQSSRNTVAGQLRDTDSSLLSGTVSATDISMTTATPNSDISVLESQQTSLPASETITQASGSQGQVSASLGSTLSSSVGIMPALGASGSHIGTVSSSAGSRPAPMSGIAAALLGNRSTDSQRPSSLLSSLTTSSAAMMTSSASLPAASSASIPDDTVFGVSLRRGLGNNAPSRVFNPNVRNLVSARPPIRRLNVNSVFEPNAAAEVALTAQGEPSRMSRSEADNKWTAVLRIVSRLEGVQGPRRHDSSVSSILSRLTAVIQSVTESSTESLSQTENLRLYQQLVQALDVILSESQETSVPSDVRSSQETSVPSDVRSQITPLVSELNRIIMAVQSMERRGVHDTDTDSEPPARRRRVEVTDSATNTETTLTRSFGVSTDDLRSGTNTSSATVSSSAGPEANQGRGLSRAEPLRVEPPARPPRLPYGLIAFDSTNNTVNRYQRVMRWRLGEKVENLDSHDNVVVLRCKIHNDAGVDISQDGTILALFVKNPNTAQCPGFHRGALHDTMLRLISLREETLGMVLHQITLAASPVSLSISPLNGYVIVGLSGWKHDSEQPMLKYDIYKVPPSAPAPLKMARSVYMARPGEPRALVNCVKWLPSPGQGLVIGTNKGSVIVCHSSGSATVNLNMSSYDMPAASRHFIL